jgi:Coenzyme PQQ synthesis protein D (PqqD)
VTVDVSGRIELPSLGWAVDVRVAGLTPEMAARIEERWALSSSSSAAAAAATIDLDVVSDPVGMPPTPLVEVRVVWHSPQRATFTASSVEADVELAGASISARGRAHAPHARGALESTFRAVAALSLARRHVVVLHASAVASIEGALVFLGPSEAGKTTTARRLGREGWKRLADDMIAIDLAGEPRLHILPFERSGRWSPAAHAGFVPPLCLAAGLVRKDLPLSVEAGDAVAAWAAARLALPCPPGDQEATLRDFAALCRVPVFDVGVPAAGALAPLARAMTANHPRKRLDDPGQPGHAGRALAHPASSPAVFDEARVLNRAPNVAWRVLDGKAVLVAPSSPLVHTLNPVGTFVWELADGRPISTIVDAVVNEFAVTRTQALADVELFVAELMKKNMLTVTEEA